MDVAVSSHLPLTDFYFSPSKLFEYLACGVPTVAADIGQPAHSYQQGETGLLYRPGDASSLAAKSVNWWPIRLGATDGLAGGNPVLQQHTWDNNAAAVIGWLRPVTPETAGVRMPRWNCPFWIANCANDCTALRARIWPQSCWRVVCPLSARAKPA